MELCTGGHLEDYLNMRPSRFLPENEAKALIRQLVSAVAHIHSRGICHRDIKLQNILIENEGASDPQVKLIDFGFATRFVGVTPLKTRIGTPYTTAPEVFKQSYDERCDIWSVGVVSYVILSGFRPFPSSAVLGEYAGQGTKAALVSSIIKGKFHFNHSPFRQVSSSCIHFLKSMLTNNYRQRWYARDALNSGWMSSSSEELSIDFSALSRNLDSPIALAVKNMRTKPTWPYLTNIVMTIVAFNRSQQTCPELRQIFELFDSDSLGFLDLARFGDAMHSIAPDMTAEGVEELFHTMDIDLDKQLSFIEFLGGSINPRDVSANEFTEAFRLLDAEGKGIIIVDDFYRIILEAPKKRRNSKLSKVPDRHGGGLSVGGNQEDISSSGTGFFSENLFVRGERELRLAARIRHMLVSADTDVDGALSFSEFLHGALAENIGVLSEEDELNASQLLAFDEEKAKSASLAAVEKPSCFPHCLSFGLGKMRYRVRRFFKRKSSRAVPINTEVALQMHFERLEEERRQQQDGDRRDAEVSRQVHLDEETEGELVDGLDPVLLNLLNGTATTEGADESFDEAAAGFGTITVASTPPMTARIDAYLREKEDLESRQDLNPQDGGNSLYDASYDEDLSTNWSNRRDSDAVIQKRQPSMSYSSFVEGPGLPAPAPMIKNDLYTDGFSSSSGGHDQKSEDRGRDVTGTPPRSVSAKVPKSASHSSNSNNSSSSNSNLSSSSEKLVVVRRSRSAIEVHRQEDHSRSSLSGATSTTPTVTTTPTSATAAPTPDGGAPVALTLGGGGSPGPIRLTSAVRGGKLPALSRP
jgi:calcium-dependent protein kinase